MAKDRLIFDSADADPITGTSDNVGAYLRDAVGNLLTSTLVGGKQALDVNILSASDDGVYSEDSAAVNGASGVSVFQVRQDSLASSVDTDGDYGWFKMNDRGALWTAPVGTVADSVADTENPVKIGSKAKSGALAAISNGNRADMISDLYRRVFVNDSPQIGILASTGSIGTSASSIVTSALSGRRYALLYNGGSKDMFLGGAGVSVGNGFPLFRGAIVRVDAGDAIDIKAVSSAAAQTMNILELA